MPRLFRFYRRQLQYRARRQWLLARAIRRRRGLRPVVDRINRQPMDTLAVEVTNTVYVIARQSHQKQALHLLENALEAADLPTRDLKVHAFGEDAVEIEAVLAANAVDGEHLERLTRQLAEQPFSSQALWSPSTTE